MKTFCQYFLLKECYRNSFLLNIFISIASFNTYSFYLIRYIEIYDHKSLLAMTVPAPQDEVKTQKTLLFVLH